MVAHFAVPLTGGVLLALNVQLAPGEIGYIRRHSATKLLIVAEELLPSVPRAGCRGDVAEVVVIDASGPDAAAAGTDAIPRRTYEEFRTRGNAEPLPWTVEDEQAMISINTPQAPPVTPRAWHTATEARI